MAAAAVVAATVPAPTTGTDGASSVHWFRKGLRLHDNPALLAAVRGARCVRCVYILDPWFAASSSVGINRWRFLLQSLEDLDTSLRKLNSRLFVVRGQPADVFPRLFKEWGVTRLTFEYDSEPFGKERDAAIMKMAKEAGVEVVTENSHTLYDLDRIIDLNGQKPPLTYKRFQAIISRMELPKKPVGAVSSQQMESCRAEIRENHDDTYGVPSLEELGFPTEGLGPAVWQGGETEALARLDKHLERKAWVANYERPRMNANSLLASPTGLSPYLRFGCLSCRLFYYRLWDLYKKVKKNSTPPLSLFGQLLWREFFYTAATNNPRFDRMEGNPICIQIPWDRNPEALAKWAEGKTGFPWIDAIMTQLRQEGWIHHLARHAVACFLTRGDLWVSWESGVRVFDELLLDADFSVNAGSWMWLSCSAFFQQFFHCYCPVGFGRRTDPSGDYIRRYLPKLKGFPSRYIYEPWNAPESVQKAAKCIIGVDYPRPIVNHAETSRLNIERMKQIYQQLSRYRGLCLLASVPSCVEDLSHPVADPSSSQAGSISNTGPRPIASGPASPKRKLEAAEEPPSEELSKRARVTEMPAQEPPSKDA
ncbi:cryptochrome-2 isoform X1 [Microtus oregoni]|uniref:cryptochrome-2 isoform X1 n=1 Tax=Microtus oregoni TaxID=111838 RepID=UPI001BB1D99C|nr:cryptochrome-2 isoform X1 [Microtus oregoni]XP_041497234.1 cryptochrome-2 isoform X1 [Microtus oregoni]XP_041497235.1 cryptochrome-2 isoform X1 [Microtus oregoni]XP_041497236.1 cryptochrome-2 isoform X1 [Microtus oregoni]